MNHSNFLDRPVLVVGATGKTGRRVVSRLIDRGVPVRGVARSTALRFDWSDDSTWGPVFDGVDAAYVVFSPDLLVPGSDDLTSRFAMQARRAGLRRLVLLSGRGEEEARRAEDAVRAAGPPLTVVRAGWFVQNFTEGEFAPLVDDGLLALPVDDVAEPFVDCDDIADVVVEALLDPRHEGRTYEVTGPRSLTFADVAAELSSVTGREVRHLPITIEQAEAGWRAAGLPADVVWLLSTLFSTVFDGRNSLPGDGVMQALGRPAHDVREHLERHLGPGRSQPASARS